ncbi:MAG: putative MscS family protein YkuT [Firmicutes bacterium ADurb.Bin506]|nr:MAG: putative MscS family protein YkuT [Firmicutes bacterium ADurb.Bin506]
MPNVDATQITDGLVAALIVLLRIAIIAVAAHIVGNLLSRLVDRLFRPRGGDQLRSLADPRRVMTLRTLLKSIIRYTVYFVGAIMALGELGVDTAGLVAGAGIAGVAVGFGAQNLVRDVISGFFILFEDQYAVGDYVTLGGVSGIVEEMGLRVTKIRDFGGEVHTIPNGSIDRVTNYRGQSMRVMFDVEVPYTADPSATISLLQEAFDTHAKDIPNLVTAPQVLGVQQLGASGITLRILARAVPMEQWAVERRLKLLTVNIMAENGMKVPYPRTVVLRGEEADSANLRSTYLHNGCDDVQGHEGDKN